MHHCTEFALGNIACAKHASFTHSLSHTHIIKQIQFLPVTLPMAGAAGVEVPPASADPGLSAL